MHVNGRKFGVYQSDDNLLKMMGQTSDDDDGVSIFYLGQEGFVLKRHGVTVAIDPYLTDSVDRLPMIPERFWRRRYDPPIVPNRLTAIDLVLCTHDHLDHIDPETLLGIAQASPKCRFAVPKSCIHTVLSSGISLDRLIELTALEPYDFGTIRIVPVPGAHESYEYDEHGHDRYFGYIIEWDGIHLYHAGDTLVTERLIDTLSRFSIDVGFLPINGRDLFRNRLDIAGNMNAREAADLAATLGFDVVVPMHYDLYPNNGEPPTYFVDYMYRSHPGQKMHLFQPGERWVYHKQDRVRPAVVIIGAGKTGRGFIARLAAQSPYEIVFIDKSEELVQRLNEDRAYTVHFFQLEQTPIRVKGIRAVLSGTMDAVEILASAAVVFTAVGEQHLSALAVDLHKAGLRRSELGNDSPLDVITCENGVSPGAVLRGALAASPGGAPNYIRIAEAAIFCSTVDLPGTRLDILSESYDELPFDGGVLTGQKIRGMLEIRDFKRLLRQKIYTYNCLSACIAYLGAFKGFEGYAAAANNDDIKTMLEQILDPLNQAVANLLDVPLQDQQLFAKQAMHKFSNPEIRDSIDRNARDVARKFGPQERLIVPALQMLQMGQPVNGLALVMAAGLHYGFSHDATLKQKLLEEGVIATFSTLTGLAEQHELTLLVDQYYSVLNEVRDRPGSSLGVILSSQSPR